MTFLYKCSTKKIQFTLLSLCIAFTIISCKKFLPEERETVGGDSQYTTTLFNPILGRTSYYTNIFFKGTTTYPANFKIVNARRRNGDPAPELTDIFPVKVWNEAYTGDEKSLAEIEGKRTIQYRNLLEIGQHSGSITVWTEAKSNFIRTLPDSGYLFDIELSNSGGRRYFRDFKLMPFRERPYEPSTYDAVTGQSLSNAISPSQVDNIKGAKTGRYLSGYDIDVYIRKLSNSSATNTITFKFLDTLFNPIKPDLFALTKWDGLIHGFNMKKTETSVTYDVAYPIPAVHIPTRYTTSNGEFASVAFRYYRIGLGGLGETATLGLNFAIYEPGNWEIVFAFKNDNPKFSND